MTDELADHGNQNKRFRQQSVVHSFAQKVQSKSAPLLSRKDFEFEILSMLVEDMQPIATVERSSFKKLFKHLLPHVDLPSRRTLGRNIDDMYESHKQQLIEELNHINYISTTVDLWSSHKRGFLGITAHCIDKSTLQRVSHVLTCQRFKHSHRRQDCI